MIETRVVGGSYDGVNTFRGEKGGLSGLVESKTLNKAFRNTHDEMHFLELGIKDVVKWPMYAKVINMMSDIWSYLSNSPKRKYQLKAYHEEAEEKLEVERAKNSIMNQVKKKERIGKDLSNAEQNLKKLSRKKQMLKK